MSVRACERETAHEKHNLLQLRVKMTYFLSAHSQMDHCSDVWWGGGPPGDLGVEVDGAQFNERSDGVGGGGTGVCGGTNMCEFCV